MLKKNRENTDLTFANSITISFSSISTSFSTTLWWLTISAPRERKEEGRKEDSSTAALHSSSFSRSFIHSKKPSFLTGCGGRGGGGEGEETCWKRRKMEALLADRRREGGGKEWESLLDNTGQEREGFPTTFCVLLKGKHKRQLCGSDFNG